MCGGSDEALLNCPIRPESIPGGPHSRLEYQPKAYQIVADSTVIAATVVQV